MSNAAPETQGAATSKKGRASGATPSSKLLVGLLLMFGLFVPLVTLEAGLRIFGFRYRLYPEKIEFGWPRPEVMQNLYVPDNELLWVPKDYQETLKSLEKSPPDILFLGDSCTQFGTYDEFFAERVKSTYPERQITSAKLGVGGWTSFQGLQQLKRDVRLIHPKIATIYYGWNDHWIGFGIEDKQIAKLRSPVFTLLEHLRVAQLVVKGYLTFSQNPNAFPYRVTEDDFRMNLIEMVKESRASNIVPMLLTAPSSHRAGKEPRYLLQRHLKDLSVLVPLHQRYVSIVREVAAAEHVPLCDLAASFSQFPEEQLKGYFNTDGIHLTKKPGEGYDVLAGMLFDCFKKEGLLEKL